jgi:hypothetical protein
MEEPQGLVPPGTTAYCPLETDAEIVSGTARLLTKVRVFELLVVPTTCAGNVTAEGEKVKGNTPVPVKLKICVLAAPVMKATEPLNEPATGGLKPAVTVQLEPEPKAPPHGLAPLPITLYPLLATTLVIVIVDPLALVAVTVLPVETLPARVELKVTLVGENVSGEALPPEPTPVRLINWVGNEALLIASEPLMFPLEVGVKVTLMVHFAIAANVPLHGLIPLPIAE